MEILDVHYHANISGISNEDDDEMTDEARAHLMHDQAWDDEDIIDSCCCCREDESCCCCPSESAPYPSVCHLLLSRPGRIALFLLSMLFIYLLYIAVTYSSDITAFGEESVVARQGINVSRAHEILSSLCSSYDKKEIAGDACHRLCYKRNWEVTDFYEGNKVVIVTKKGGQTEVFKGSKPFIGDYEDEDTTLSEEAFIDKVLETANNELKLGWPPDLARHLLSTLWPSSVRSAGLSLTHADRRSLWALLQQPEYILFRVIPLSRVTPKVVGSCGHLYEMETLVAFRMKGYYMNLKGKILIHLMGTLKLFYEFLNEPLQWCDVRFENLGLSADYPKRFVIMDGDMMYTQSRLRTLLTSKSCTTDEDCTIGDCSSRCQADFKCSPRTNENLDVFCEKLVNKLFGNAWSKSNKYLTACHDTSTNFTQKLNDLRLTWSWTLSDV